MSVRDDEGTDLEAAIARVHAGALEDFIARRDGLAKQLRASGRRDDAAAVKALRKPSRTAWALNAAVHGGDDAIDALVGAVAATIEAQAEGGDVRGAIASLRGAVRDFAGHAARAAAQGGLRIDEATLSNAVLAVIGKPDVFEALRDGRLVDVPEAGGLDFLANLPPPPLAPPRLSVTSQPEAAKAKRAEPADEAPATGATPSRSKSAAARAAADKALRAAVQRSAVGVSTARERAAAAQRDVTRFETKLAAADERLRKAEEEAEALRSERDRAREAAEAAAAELAAAEQAAADAEQALASAPAEE